MLSKPVKALIKPKNLRNAFMQTGQKAEYMSTCAT